MRATEVGMGPAACEGDYLSRRDRGYRGRIKAKNMSNVSELGDRFWSKVNKDGQGGCWEWIAGKSTSGHGKFRVGKTMLSAHRVSFEWTNGVIDPGLQVDHICHNRACVNPDHLRAVPPKWNSQNRRGATAHSKTGIRGVTWHKAGRKYRATGYLRGKHIHLGSFENIEDAKAVADEWREANYEGLHGIPRVGGGGHH